MGAVLASHPADTGHPLIDKPGILTGAKMAIVVNPAGKT
jgi:hypothetical protein